MQLFPSHDRSSAVERGGQRQRRRLRYTAAASIAVGGYIHLCLYRNGFRAIPGIGTGFLLQVVASALVAGALVIGANRSCAWAGSSYAAPLQCQFSGSA